MYESPRLSRGTVENSFDFLSSSDVTALESQMAPQLGEDGTVVGPIFVKLEL